MMRKLLLTLTLTLAFGAQAMAKDLSYVPDVLKPWVAWVMHDTKNATCADVYNGQQGKTCAMSGVLGLDMTQKGGTFTLPVRLLTAGWAYLPGDRQAWPATLAVDGKTTPFTDHHGRPAVYLEAGNYTLSGTFKWDAAPSRLRLPQGQALLDVTVDGQKVSLPQVRNERLWLVADSGRQFNKQQQENVQKDHMDVRVFRRIEDTLPAKVITLVRLTVAGSEREETLPPLLLAGTTPNTYNGSLPARLEADGKIKLQVRPGVHELTFMSRVDGVMDSLKAPAMPWGTEVWVYKPYPDLRLTDITGGTQIDPNQTDLPYDWRDLAAYQMADGSALTFTTQRRGAEKPPANSLHLNRTLWLDFDGDGLSAADTINGSMWSGWRLSLQEGLLTRADVNGSLTPITTDGENMGVELRNASVNLNAQSRLDIAGRSILPTTIPVNGWGLSMESASAVLNLPVGWNIIGVSGVDSATGTWISAWNLFDLFYALILSLMVGKLWRPSWGVLTLAVMLLTFQQLEEIKVMIFMTLVFVGLIQFLPEGKLQRFSRNARYILVAIIALHSWPLLLGHIQFTLHPQLASPYLGLQPVSNTLFKGMAGSTQAQQIHTEKRYRAERAAAPRAKGMHSQPTQDLAMSREMNSNAFMDEEMDFAAGAAMDKSMMFEGVVSAAEPHTPPLAMDAIDPDAKLQTGLGLPNWSWRQVHLSWNGPVAKDTTIKAWLISPLLNRLVHLLSAVAFALLILRLAVNGDLRMPKLPRKGVVASVLALVLMGGILSSPAHATDIPSQEMLNTLKQRLLEPSKCLPACATMHSAVLDLTADNISLKMEVDALEEVLIPVPTLLGNSWRPASVSINGQPSHSVIVISNDVYTLVGKGRHTVSLKGKLPKVSRDILNFNLPPKEIKIRSQGWQVTGLDKDGKVMRALTLVRTTPNVQKDDNPKVEQTFAPLQFPGFVTVERRLSLGVNWRMQTVVTLQSGEATTIKFPLLDGERLLSNQPVEDGHAVVTLVRPGQRVQFNSELDIRDGLMLTAHENVNWSEVWSVNIHPKWRLSFEGITPIYHVTNNQWQPQWRPYPGESVNLSVSRPLGSAGEDMTLHSADLKLSPGSRSRTANLTLDLETSKPRNHVITLPADAKLTALRLNSQVIQTEADNGKVTLSLPTGRHNVFLSWREDGDVPYALRTPILDLGLNHVANSSISITTSPERWVVWTSGPQMGPAVLLWGILAAMVVLGFALSKVSTAPVRGWEWFLLSLGLTQLSPFLVLVPVVWILALNWREKNEMSAETPRQIFSFNAIQAVLVLLTIGAVMALFESVKHGLLGKPMTYIAGNRSHMKSLNWFQDFGSTLPDVFALTLPTLCYRILMMVWALWVAVLLLRLMRWSWQAFSKGGYWKKAPAITK